MNKVRTDHRGYATTGKPAKGCLMCVRGEKLVLFITGLCGKRCYYCPVSEKKFGVDEIYANEWKIENDKDLMEEIRLTDAKGAGITGGDPLVTLEKTCNYIRFLKKEKGKHFHIHLYTPLKLVTPESLKELHEAGLDEIRFHPEVENESEWPKIKLAKKYHWDIGIEIPCVPGKEKETKKLIDYIEEKVDFINLNELEVSDTEVEHYQMQEHRTRDETTYAVEGSREMAMNLLEYAKEKKYTSYFCSAMLKDSTQMGERIKRRAKMVKKEFDKVTPEGMLIRGAIYYEKLAPGVEYRHRLANADKKEIIEKLIKAEEDVKKLKIRYLEIDKDKLRLLTSKKEVIRLAKKIHQLGLIPAIVEEYPTKDGTEIEIELL